MNNKGFTLIELLATIIIISLVGAITTHSLINTINQTKLKSERLFINKLSRLIDDYLSLNPPTNETEELYTFQKCHDKNCTETYSITATKMLKSDGTSIYLSDLINQKILAPKDLINPKNNEQCHITENSNPEIIVYKDSEYIYYYYLDLSGTNTTCNITSKNAIINTLPKDLKSKVGLL